MKTGVHWVEVSAVKVRHSSKPENLGIRRSNKMADGLFCIANAKPCSGSPVSIISYESERLSRNKRRMASSSSITSSFCIASSLLCSRALLGANKSRGGRGGRRFFLRGIVVSIQELPHPPAESLFINAFMHQYR